MSHYDDTKIFVGNLPKDIRTSEVEDIFYKFGRIRHIDIRGYSSGAPYAFLEFDHYKDARDAIRYRDGYNFDGYTLKVEYQRGPRRSRGRYGDDGYYDRNGDRPGYRKSQPPQRTNYRAKISGLPPSGSWQDVKDHVRKAGEVAYANVFSDGTGVIEFFKEDDLRRAVRELDKTRFKSHEGETATIRLKVQGEESSSHVSRSPRSSISRSRSRSISRSYSRSRSLSRSRSRSGSYSRSRSRSRSVESTKNSKKDDQKTNIDDNGDNKNVNNEIHHDSSNESTREKECI